jgi:hypothetical protein
MTITQAHTILDRAHLDAIQRARGDHNTTIFEMTLIALRNKEVMDALILTAGSHARVS